MLESVKKTASALLVTSQVLGEPGKALAKDPLSISVEQSQHVTVHTYYTQPVKSGEFHEVRVDVSNNRMQAINVFCQTYGSDQGNIDMSNPIESINHLGVLRFKVFIPNPSSVYDGKYGYGFFIVCNKSTNSQQVYRVVVPATHYPKVLKDGRSSFSFVNDTQK